MAKKKHKKNDIYGRCPSCERCDWHKYKGLVKVIDVGYVSVFKCRNCEKKFGLLKGEKDGYEKDHEERELYFADELDCWLDDLFKGEGI